MNNPKFVVGDKVFSKAGMVGMEIGVVNKILDNEKILVRLFTDNQYKEEFNVNEVLNQNEHDVKVAQRESKDRNDYEEMKSKNLDPYF